MYVKLPYYLYLKIAAILNFRHDPIGRNSAEKICTILFYSLSCGKVSTWRSNEITNSQNSLKSQNIMEPIYLGRKSNLFYHMAKQWSVIKTELFCERFGIYTLLKVSFRLNETLLIHLHLRNLPISRLLLFAERRTHCWTIHTILVRTIYANNCKTWFFVFRFRLFTIQSLVNL